MKTFFWKMQGKGNEALTESNKKKKKICIVKEIDLR